MPLLIVDILAKFEWHVSAAKQSVSAIDDYDCNRCEVAVAQLNPQLKAVFYNLTIYNFSLT